MKFFLRFIIVAAGCFIFGCSEMRTADIPAVENFNLNRYCGKWYEIARLPNWFERGMSDVTATYTLASDGSVKVVNRGIRHGKKIAANGKARFAGKSDQGELEVSFQWPFWGGYRVIWLNEDYTLAAVCGDRMNYLWILARTPDISFKELDRVIDFLRSRGFFVENLEYTGHEKSSIAANTAS